MSRKPKRRYVSEVRDRAADATRTRILTAAKSLFTRSGIDRVTIAQIAAKAGVAVATIYALYKSKEGILRELMNSALFGSRFHAARDQLEHEKDAVKLLSLSAHVARAIYDNERSELGLMRGISAFSPALQKMEQEFEQMRFQMQEARVELLFAQSKAKKGLSIENARCLLWMYTSRDVYRMLVQEGGWSADKYQQWLSDTLVSALTDC
jgi:AcrR family transcriptional regulator